MAYFWYVSLSVALLLIDVAEVKALALPIDVLAYGDALARRIEASLSLNFSHSLDRFPCISAGAGDPDTRKPAGACTACTLATG